MKNVSGLEATQAAALLGIELQAVFRLLEEKTVHLIDEELSPSIICGRTFNRGDA